MAFKESFDTCDRAEMLAAIRPIVCGELGPDCNRFGLQVEG
jgi:hypothetical protein